MSKKSTQVMGLIVVSSLSMLVSCADSHKSEVKSNKVSSTEASQLAAQGKDQEAAAMYARVGELLLSKVESIGYAEEMFQKSLELDKHNNKANFYSALIAPGLSMKGAFARFKSLVPDQEAVKKMEKEINDKGVREIIEFAYDMPSGTKPAKSFEELRKFYRATFVSELKKSLEKIDQIKSDKFTIDLDVAKYNPKDTKIQTCYTSSSGQYYCDAQTVEYEGKFAKIIDQNDLKALRVSFRTYENALLLGSSVGLSGLEEVKKKIESSKTKTDKEIVAAIKSQPNFLKLEGSREELREIFDHSEDVINDTLDFAKISKELCGGEARVKNLYSDLCVDEKTIESLNDVLLYVVGPKSVLLGYDANDEEVRVEIQLRAMIDSSVTSLQEILPNKFDAKGRMIDVKDQTFGGVFPEGDLVAKIKTLAR